MIAFVDNCYQRESYFCLFPPLPCYTLSLVNSLGVFLYNVISLSASQAVVRSPPPTSMDSRTADLICVSSTCFANASCKHHVAGLYPGNHPSWSLIPTLFSQVTESLTALAVEDQSFPSSGWMNSDLSISSFWPQFSSVLNLFSSFDLAQDFCCPRLYLFSLAYGSVFH